MVLHLIGLGLGDERDITVKGLELIRKADIVYLEHYTSILSVDIDRLRSFYDKEILIAERDLVEKEAEEKLLIPAKTEDVCLLVVGDPFSATTHTDLVLRARELGVTIDVVHNASIMDAVGIVGLELYKYGRTTSIPFWEFGFEPLTPYDAIRENKERGLHTLCLLDIKVKELPKEMLLKQTLLKQTSEGEETNSAIPRFMSINVALRQLLKMEEMRKGGIILPETLVVGVARLGQPDQKIVAGTVEELRDVDFGEPLHSLIVPGTLQIIEEESLGLWRIKKA